MAARIQCIMNQAVRGQTPYLRSISRAESPFLLAHISKMTSTHFRGSSDEEWGPVVRDAWIRH